MLSNLKNFVNKHKFAVAGSSALICSAVPTFAEEISGSGSLTYYTVDSSLFDPLLSSVNANMSVIVPVGLGILALLAGVKLIPRLINTFIG